MISDPLKRIIWTLLFGISLAIGISILFEPPVHPMLFGDKSDGDFRVIIGHPLTLSRDYHFKTIVVEDTVHLNGYRLLADSIYFPSSSKGRILP